MDKNTCIYETDYFGWIHEQANHLRNEQYDQVDMGHLIEEMEYLGNSEQSKLESHLKNLLLHLLKAKYQTYMHTRSWDLSIKNSFYRFKRTLEKNPSMKHTLPEVFKDAYHTARIEAADETGLDEKVFPEVCPWTIEEILERKE